MMFIHEIQKLPDWFIELLLIVIGAGIGRFINVLTTRLPLAILANADSSVLSSCSLDAPSPKKLHGRAHFPILNCFLRQPKEVKVDKKTANYYFLLELITILLTLTIYQVMGPHTQTVFTIVLSWWLLALAVIDFDYYLLPDQLTLSLLWLGLLVNRHGLFIPLEHAVYSVVCAYVLMWAIDSIYYLVRHKNGLGQGDWKLLAAIAAWFGFIPALYILALAALFGSVVGIAGLVSKKFKLTSHLAFGPFLCVATLLFVLTAQYLPIHIV